ncbi:1-acyl-sn-glycerol-3-phosphate acyltransferase [Dactylosporangium aurantiacum]|uniref:1-acyl-sn-glycerol-3-phosphate acyltransferase n=1 Tax=Dactylosporangium aurantiacum TaxID=35754 RepID=A0A9Q9IAL0_9ACTN|nr:lysophospholipid acyltransferase family protein [Dactylosporangium aurantiacum]MDG6104980.1 lysophospholipid acyltransferase family protein [Dactylosporangium aurantiacum]UWZ51516.1 1-acyl-sn-glycerol-3-phosphate acyltransferase [Dactylosporangium aurantiacum]
MRLLRLLFSLWYRPTVEGLHHVPRHGAVVIAGNHLSFYDSVVIPLVVPRRVVFLAKAEYFDRGRLRRWWFRTTGAVPVRRGDAPAARAALDTALDVLAAGGAFGIYPEGTRSRDGRLYRGRTGVAWLALTAGVPVVPVALTGTGALPRRARITVRFGAPLRCTGLPGDARARRAATDEVMDAIAALSGQERVPRYNTVP